MSTTERWNKQARKPVRPYGRIERCADAAAAFLGAARVMGAALCLVGGLWLFLFGLLHLFMFVMRLIGWSDV